ncbi:MAG: SulP family inorganic anion transporter [Candidatus Sulfotelmatobacter sp.]
MVTSPQKIQNLGQRLRSALPILQWAPQYQKQWLRLDFVAGLTLAAYAIPVSLAYASLAGLPGQAGLYCYLLGGVAYAAFGTSRQMAVGPTSAISILIGASLGSMASGDTSRQIQLAMATAVLVAVISVLAWLFRAGNIINFISETVLSGFKVGAGLVIISTQLPKLFGLSTGGSNFFSRMLHLAQHLGQTNLPSLGVGAGALALLILGEWLLPRRPVALFVVVLSIVFMSVIPMAGLGVKTIGSIPAGLPHLSWPLIAKNEVDDLLALALGCFLLAYVEGISVARTFALKHGYEIDADQELLALGAANLASGLGHGYPLAGGMSQSAVNEKGGAKTPLALVFASLGVCAVLLFLTGLMKNLPDPVLAAVVFMAVKGLILPKELKQIRWVSKSEFRIAMVAMLGVLVLGILHGVLIAAALSILVLLRRGSRPRVLLLGRLPGSDSFVDVSRYPEHELVPGVLVFRIESGLFYFNVQNVKAEILSQAGAYPGLKLVILDLSTSANIDLAAGRMLRNLHRELGARGANLKLAEVHGEVRDLLQAEGLQEHIEGIEERVGVAALVAPSIC